MKKRKQTNAILEKMRLATRKLLRIDLDASERVRSGINTVSAPLKLYVKTWCPWCITARQYLAKRGFRFEEIDVEADRAAYAEMIRLSGQSYTPTLSVDDKLLADFGPDELQNFLKKHQIEP